jgi:hypothetical protein
VTVQVGDVVVPSLAREAIGDEYEAIFEHAAAVFPGYHLYRRESPVHIPIVVLQPVVEFEPAQEQDATTAR